MDFIARLFAKLTSALVGKQPAVNVEARVKELYPDAIYMKDIFPTSVLNVEFIVLPSVENGLPENLKDVVQKKDGVVTVVFTGNTAKTIVELKTDALGMAQVLATKLLERTEIDEAVKRILDKVLEAYNKIMPGEDVTSEQLMKKVLGMLSLFMRQQQAFKNAQEFYKVLVAKFIVDGNVRIALPDSVDSKLAKLGLGKLAEKNEAAALVVKLLEAQINTVLENALKGLRGDVQVA